METTKYEFDANVDSLMSIIINSVYSHKDFFIRELISNCSDALDKLALEYNNYTNLLPHNEWFIEVRVEGDKLIIADSGIGMTKSDLISFLGSIATSGTKKFREALQNKDKQLIGQFGLGFYSAFLVADKVEVITKHPNDTTYRWESTGSNGFTVSNHEEMPYHGTTLILHMKKGEEEYLQTEKLTELIKRFSMFIQYPIYILEEKKKEEEKPTEEKMLTEDNNEENKDEAEVKDEETKDETNVEDVKEEKSTEPQLVRKKVNTEKELWNKKIEDIPHAELTTFYKQISNDWDDFLECKSWKLEGMVDFNLLLFIPKRMPFNLFDKSFNKNRIKLYCANVFVTDELNCLPDYLGFVSGIVSTDDLPMSVSRENVQGTSFHKMLKKMIVNKVIDMISNLKDFNEFYKEYSTAMKLMARDDERFVPFLRYHTTKSLETMLSLDEYIERQSKPQTDENNNEIIKDENNNETKKEDSFEKSPIYVITGLSKEECLDSFYLKKYKDNEVILMCEPADELLLQSLKKYKERPIKRVTVSDINDTSDTEFNKELVSLLNLEKVVVNNSLDIPCLVTTNEYGSSGTFEKIMQAQNANHPYFMFGMSKKILEVNMDHPLVKRIKGLYENKNDLFKKVAKAMYGTCLLSCGYKISDLKHYCEGIYDLLSKDEEEEVL